MTVAPAAIADGGRVNDRHHLGDVLLQQSIEQRFVTILKAIEKDIALKIILFALVVLVNARQLFFDSRRVIGQQPEQAKLSPIASVKALPSFIRGCSRSWCPLRPLCSAVNRVAWEAADLGAFIIKPQAFANSVLPLRAASGT